MMWPSDHLIFLYPVRCWTFYTSTKNTYASDSLFEHDHLSAYSVFSLPFAWCSSDKLWVSAQTWPLLSPRCLLWYSQLDLDILSSLFLLYFCLFFFFLIIHLAVPVLSCQVALVVKNLPAKAGDVRCRFDPWVGKIPWRGGTATHSSVLAWESHGQRSLVGHRVTKSRTRLKRLGTRHGLSCSTLDLFVVVHKHSVAVCGI